MEINERGLDKNEDRGQGQKSEKATDRIFNSTQNQPKEFSEATLAN